MYNTSLSKLLLFDDNLNAVPTVKSERMLGFGFYDDSSAEYRAKMCEVCDYYIKHIAKLEKIR